MSDEQIWAAIDGYIAEQLIGDDAALDAALQASAEAGLPAIAVSPPQGKLLHLLARSIGARSVLEIGTLGGYSTIALARGVGPGGRVVTLEYDQTHADVARRNLDRADVGERVEIIVGAALERPQAAEPAAVGHDHDRPVGVDPGTGHVAPSHLAG